MDIYIYIALIGIAAGFVKGISAFGSSLVTIPLLVMVLGVERIDEIIVMMITFNVVLNFLLVKENNALKMENLKEFRIIIIFGAIFTLIGLGLLKNLEGSYITTIAAIMIFVAILVTAYNLFSPHKIHMKESIVMQAIVGMLSGLGNGIASIDGPPVVFYLLATDAPKQRFKGTLATHFLVLGVIGIIGLIILDMYTVNIFLNTLFMGAFSVIGLLGGMWISSRLKERTFKTIILVILLLLDIKMLFF